MPEIKTNQEYRMENVLSVRKKMTQVEIQQTLAEIANYIKTAHAEKAGPIVTTTYVVEQLPNGPVLDMEILIPLNKEIEVSEPYIFKKLFHLKYAIYARHVGNPQFMQNTLNQMIEFLKRNVQTQITPVYCVNVKEKKQSDAIYEMTTDLYIGVNPSKL